ncbi:MAG: hypothetical protein ACI9EW_000676 [Cellvibrionaceae bacterium]|jgi:hypothetical protein
MLKDFPNQQKVVRVMTKYKLGEEPSDFAYWQTKSPLERLAALEAIRAEYNEWKYGPDIRFHRVYKVIKR